MRKIIIFLILILVPIQISAFTIKSENAILYNLDEERVLYELNAHERVSIASMTKIMTAIVALENIDDVNEYIVMTPAMFKTLKEENASVAGFRVGEKVTYLDLLYGLMLPSGADAAQGLAIMTSGDIDSFVSKMNKKAQSLGLKNTHFANPTGLDHKDNYSTVDDVATILKYALKNKTFAKIFTTEKYVTSNKQHTFKSTRIKSSIDTSFIDGSKTGFTYDAGLCMASIASHNNTNYLLVTAKAPYDNKTNHLKDAKTIYNYYFNNYGNKTILTKEEILTTINLVDGRKITYQVEEDVVKYLNNECVLKKEYNGSNSIDYDTKLGAKLGEYIIKCDDEIIYKKDILAIQKIHEPQKINYSIIIMSVLSIFIIILLLVLKRKKK